MKLFCWDGPLEGTLVNLVGVKYKQKEIFWIPDKGRSTWERNAYEQWVNTHPSYAYQVRGDSLRYHPAVQGFYGS